MARASGRPRVTALCCAVLCCPVLRCCAALSALLAVSWRALTDTLHHGPTMATAHGHLICSPSHLPKPLGQEVNAITYPLVHHARTVSSVLQHDLSPPWSQQAMVGQVNEKSTRLQLSGPFQQQRSPSSGLLVFIDFFSFLFSSLFYSLLRV